jgi:hypothetical protein
MYEYEDNNGKIEAFSDSDGGCTIAIDVVDSPMLLPPEERRKLAAALDPEATARAERAEGELSEAKAALVNTWAGDPHSHGSGVKLACEQYAEAERRLAAETGDTFDTEDYMFEDAVQATAAWYRESEDLRREAFAGLTFDEMLARPGVLGDFLRDIVQPALVHRDAAARQVGIEEGRRQVLDGLADDVAVVCSHYQNDHRSRDAVEGFAKHVKAVWSGPATTPKGPEPADGEWKRCESRCDGERCCVAAGHNGLHRSPEGSTWTTAFADGPTEAAPKGGTPEPGCHACGHADEQHASDVCLADDCPCDGYRAPASAAPLEPEPGYRAGFDAGRREGLRDAAELAGQAGEAAEGNGRDDAGRALGDLADTLDSMAREGAPAAAAPQGAGPASPGPYQRGQEQALRDYIGRYMEAWQVDKAMDIVARIARIAATPPPQGEAGAARGPDALGVSARQFLLCEAARDYAEAYEALAGTEDDDELDDTWNALDAAARSWAGTPPAGAPHGEAAGPPADDVEAKARALITAGQAFWDAKRLAGEGAGVVWLQDTTGRVLVFTRGEYRDAMMAAVERHTPVRYFDVPEPASPHQGGAEPPPRTAEQEAHSYRAAWGDLGAPFEPTEPHQGSGTACREPGCEGKPLLHADRCLAHHFPGKPTPTPPGGSEPVACTCPWPEDAARTSHLLACPLSGMRWDDPDPAPPGDQGGEGGAT